MRRFAVPLAVLAMTWLAFAFFVSITSHGLPERVATHFRANGTPDGWMTRAGHVRFTLLAGAFVPLFVVGVFTTIRLLGGAGLNIPNRKYWLDAGRRDATYDHVQRMGIWLAVLLVAFFGAMHHAIVAANARSPIALSGVQLGWISGAFTATVFAWIALLLARFFRKPA